MTENGAFLDNMELVDELGISSNSFNLPIEMRGHCQVSINSTHNFFAGGGAKVSDQNT